MWQYISNHDLNGSHDSVVDVKAQTDIVIHKIFQGFSDRKESICLVDSIFGQAEQQDMAKLLEPLKPGHEPLFELVEGDDFT